MNSFIDGATTGAARCCSSRVERAAADIRRREHATARSPQASSEFKGRRYLLPEKMQVRLSIVIGRWLAPTPDGPTSKGWLVGFTKVAQLLGVSESSAARYLKRPDFPTPLHRLAPGNIWYRQSKPGRGHICPCAGAGRRRARRRVEGLPQHRTGLAHQRGQRPKTLAIASLHPTRCI
jgi:hypothetical protein